MCACVREFVRAFAFGLCVHVRVYKCVFVTKCLFVTFVLVIF